MLVAQKTQDGTYRVGTVHELFPDVSFPDSGPNPEWYEQNNIMKINLAQQYDPDTEMLESSLPYETGDGWVYITRVVPRPDDIIINK